MEKIKRKNGRNSVENQRFPAVSIRYDSDWARTSDLYPVKVALSQLSYGIMVCNTGYLFC